MVKPFVVYGRPGCPWCDRVRELLAQHERAVHYVDLTEVPAKRQELIEMGCKTVPQVFLDGERIGGFEATAEFLARG